MRLSKSAWSRRHRDLRVQDRLAAAIGDEAVSGEQSGVVAGRCRACGAPDPAIVTGFVLGNVELACRTCGRHALSVR